MFVDLTKYLLYKTTEKDIYEVNNFDFNIFNPDNFTNVSGGGQTSKDLIGFIQAMEGGMSGDYVDGDNYIVYDGGDGVLTVGYGIVVGDADGTPWHPDVIPNPYAGLRVPKSVVDKLFDEEIERYRNALDRELSNQGVTLKQCQYDAMISFLYNCGPAWADELVNAYKNGGDQGYYDFTIQFVNSNGQYLLGLERRRNEEYELFTKGDYVYDP